MNWNCFLMRNFKCQFGCVVHIQKCISPSKLKWYLFIIFLFLKLNYLLDLLYNVEGYYIIILKENALNCVGFKSLFTLLERKSIFHYNTKARECTETFWTL